MIPQCIRFRLYQTLKPFSVLLSVCENCGTFHHYIDKFTPFNNCFSIVLFRLKWNDKEKKHPRTASKILRALVLANFVQLESLALIDAGSGKPDWKNPPNLADTMVRFAKMMANLSCCCLIFKQMNAEYMNEGKQKVEKDVVQTHPTLWFYLGRSIPNASDLGVPLIHYHQIVAPMSFALPLFMNAPLEHLAISSQMSGSSHDSVFRKKDINGPDSKTVPSMVSILNSKPSNNKNNNNY